MGDMSRLVLMRPACFFGASGGGQVTPNGSQVISGSSDKTLRVWEAGTGKPLRTLTGHTDWVRCCAVTPDGSQVISGSDDNTLRVWEAGTGKALRTLTGHTNPVMCCAVTPDGSQVISGSVDHTLRVWEAGTGKPLRTLTGHKDTVTCCAVTPDGTRIVSGSRDGTVRIWGEAPQGGGTSRPPAPRRGAQTVEAVERLRRSRERDAPPPWSRTSADAFTEATVLKVGSPVRAVAITPDGTRILSGSADGVIRIWDIASGARLATYSVGSHVYGLAVNPKNKSQIVIALRAGTCMILEIQ